MRAWLSGLEVTAEGTAHGPAHCGGAALAAIGAEVHFVPSKSQKLTGPDGSTGVSGWIGERAARIGSGLPQTPRHPLAAVYIGLRAATALLEGRRLVPATVASELATGLGSGSQPELLRGADGWFVARWRSPSERALMACLGDWRQMGIEAIGAHARELRLLVAPVRRPARSLTSPAITPGCLKTNAWGPIRVVDWSTLWAGPWAAGRLAAEGAEVDRIEHPTRRDGYPAGSPAYRRFNQGKQLHLIDLATSGGRNRATKLLESADVVISGHTPRVLANFGFDDDWLATQGPRLLVELVAYEPPLQDHPGLGEHGAAMAGLLWRRGRPSPALPWADPLLGAQSLLAIQAWIAAGRPSGARVRLTLEGAASLAVRTHGAV